MHTLIFPPTIDVPAIPGIKYSVPKVDCGKITDPTTWVL